MAYTPKTWTTGETITAAELQALENGLAAAASQLVPTATKTAVYTAAVGDLAVMNVAGGATTLTLPTAPANKAQVGFLAVGATTAAPLTVNRGGTDTLGPSGATSVTAVLANEVTVYQYDAPNTRWLPVSNVKPQAALDGRFLKTADVSTSGTPTGDALKAAYATKPASWKTDLAGGALVAHRGSYGIHPENTIEAFRASIATGAKAVKYDVDLLLDGSFGVIHDATVDRTTTSTGAASGYTAGAWKNLVIPAATNFSAAWGNLNPPLWTDVLNEIGGRVVHLIDPKDGAPVVPALISEITRRGLANSCVIGMDVGNGSTLGWVAQCTAAGVGSYPYYNGSSPISPTIATVLATSPTYVGIGYQYTDADITTVVTACHAAGVKVIGHSLNRRYARDRMLGLGVDVIMSNDHIYLADNTRRLTSDRFALNTPTPGLISAASPESGTLAIPPVSGGKLKLPNTTRNIEFMQMGTLCPIANPAGTYTISATVTIDTMDVVTTRHVDFFVCAPDDMPFYADQKQAGYNFNLLLDGTMRGFLCVPGATADGLKAAGTATQKTGNQASTALSATQSIPITIVVTPTTLTFTRTDTSVSVVITDSTYRGAYFSIGKAGSTTGSNGLAASVSAVSVA